MARKMKKQSEKGKMQRRKNDERSNFDVHNRGTTEWNKCQTMSVKCILSLARTKDASQKNEKRARPER